MSDCVKKNTIRQGHCIHRKNTYLCGFWHFAQYLAKVLGTYEPMPEEADKAMKALIAADQAV